MVTGRRSRGREGGKEEGKRRTRVDLRSLTGRGNARVITGGGVEGGGVFKKQKPRHTQTHTLTGVSSYLNL